MSRPIDADRLNLVVSETVKALKRLPVFRREQAHLTSAFETQTEMINDAPTLDAVEVVRCKDCRWYGEIGCAVSINCEDDKPGDHDYCSFGERKEKE